MNDSLYNMLFKLLSRSDESDIRMILSTISGYLLGKGKLSFEEMEEVANLIKKD